MKKIAASLFSCALFPISLSAQCSMREIPISQRAVLSDLIIEGKVIAKSSSWDVNHQTIYTINTIEVFKVFKGNSTTTKIEILTEGGTVGSQMIRVDPSLSLNIGDIGVFTCETVKRFNVLRETNTPQYEAYGAAQGFVKYNTEEQTATDVFKKYNDIKTEIWDAVLAPGLKTFREIKHIDLFGNNNKGVKPLAVITGFSPATVTAGTKTVLTINGSGFGATRGTGTVGFKNADNGGSSYINPVATEYLTWTDAQITVHVPSQAGSGTIQVTQGTTSTSIGTLTVSYAELNANSGGTEYLTDFVNDNTSGGYTWNMYTGFDGNASAKASFLRAFETWRCGTYVNWQNGTTTAINTIAGDNTNVVRFDVGAELPGGILGRCSSYWSSCGAGVWYVTELDVNFDDGTTWEYGPAAPSGGESDFESVALHELGHGHQLTHVINTADVMHYSLTTGQQRRTLNIDDLNGGNDVMARSLVANSCGPGVMVALNSTTCPMFAPTAQFAANPTSGCSPLIVNFTDQSSGIATAWAWDIDDNGSTDYSTQNPAHTYTSSGTYNVKLTASNVIGNTVLTKTGYITVGSASLPFVEDFEIATFPPSAWSITQNPSDSKTWTRNTSATGNGSSTACAFIDFVAYSPAGGQKDYLITKPVDLTGVTGASMTFKVAYRNYPNSLYYDTLRVYISSDCGATFSPAVYTKGGPTLATAGSSTSAFTPSLASHWRTETVNLNAYTGNNIVVKFEGRNSYGNNLYLDDINITGGNLPVVTFTGNPITLCAGGTVSFTDQSTNSPTSWAWTFAGGTPSSSSAQNPSVVYNTAGTYSVSLTATNTWGNNTSVQTNYITVNPVPTVTVTPSSTLCTGNSITLNAGGANSYSWSPATALNVTTGSSVIANPSTFTTYTVTGTSVGCINTNTVAVTVNSPPAVLLTPGSVTICEGSAATLTASGANTYVWNTGETTSGISPSPTTTSDYTVTGTTGGCANTVTATITVMPSPTVTITPSSTICAGNTITLNAGGGNSYSWSPATALSNTTGSSVIADPTTTITYSVTGTAAGCTNTKTVLITVSSATVVVTPVSDLICIGGTSTLNASGASSYAWNTGETSAGITVNPTITTNYNVTGTNTEGCTRTTTVTVTVTTSPTVTITPASTTICAGNSTTLNASGGSTYMWGTGQTSAGITVNPTSTTNYTVTGTLSGGCNNTNTATVTVNSLPPVPVITQVGNTLSSSSAAGNQWYFNSTLMPGQTNDTLVTTQNGNYYVIVTGSNGCTATSATTSVTVTAISNNFITEDGLSVFPNPTNGVFEIIWNQMNDNLYIIEISNYIGQKVYSEKVKNIGGTYRKQFDLSKSGKGIYLITIFDGANKIQKKIALM